MNENRKLIRDLVATSAGALTGNLRDLWTRSVEDLVDGGVCLDALAQSLFDVGLTYSIAIEGKRSTVEKLRALADFLEKNLPDAPRTANADRRRQN